jgi:hypothetical protein
MAAKAIFDIGTTKTQEVLFFVGRQRFQFSLDLLYVLNFALLSITILFGYTVTLDQIGLNPLQLKLQVVGSFKLE